MKRLFVFVIIIIIFSCKKDTNNGFYKIQGQILESSSNPIPIKNYALNFYQGSAQGLFGGVEGINQLVKTDNNGAFLLKYDPKKNYGLTGGGTNDNSISIYGMDTIQFSNFHPIWSPVNSAIDINLDKLYLFKKIDNLIRKIQFSNNLDVGESIELITTNAYRASYKTLTGPISRGTLLTVDTIQNCRLIDFNVNSKTYLLSLTLNNPSFHKDTTYILSIGDEKQREVQIVY